MLEELHVAQTSLESHNDLTTHHTELQLEHSALVKEVCTLPVYWLNHIRQGILSVESGSGGDLMCT